jgi:RNA polymerase sigma factor (sigma-70 family)
MNNPKESTMNHQYEQLIVENMGLVHAVAQQWYNNPHYDDLISEGYLCLCEIAPKWKPSRGKFSTLAYISLRRVMWKYLSNQPQYTNVDMYKIPYSVDWEAINYNLDLYDAIGILPKNLRLIVRLVLRGKTLTYIAGRCDITVQTISLRYQQAQAKLFKILSQGVVF